jgi:hypothetical protein
MKTTILSVLTAVGITLILSLPSPSAYASPCTYGSYHDYATNTTHYYWFHEGEYVGTSISPTAPPPACRPH